MTGCSAKGCRNSTAKGFIMKRFPRDPARRSAWAANVKREGWVPTNASCLCEVHFDDSQWEDQDWGGTPKLKRTAVPTVFCNCSYGKKRGRTSKTANTTVMTEHSYGSVQGTETNLPVISKGKFDRRYDHQYATLADEESQVKGEKKVEIRREGHDDMCPVYNTPIRKALAAEKNMDKNNNGQNKASDTTETAQCNAEKTVEINHLHGDVTLVHVSDPSIVQTPTKKDVLASFNTEPHDQRTEEAILTFNGPDQVPSSVETSFNPLLSVPANPPAPHLVKFVMLPEKLKIREEPDIKLHYNIPKVEQPCAISRVCIDNDVNETQCVSSQGETPPVDAKDFTSNETILSDLENRSCNFVSSQNKRKECNCKLESLDIAKVRTAEKVLARQGRLVRRVAALQKQLTRQKHSHEIEIEKLMKRFHELEEKFDLTRSILRSCIGDDQFTVYATQNSRGVAWSKKTIEKAVQLRNSCGVNGYNAVSKLLIPLPSDRTLRRYNQRSKPQDGIFVEILKDASD